MNSRDKHVFLQCCFILEDLCLLHKGKGPARNFFFTALLIMLMIWKTATGWQSEDYLLRILMGLWKVAPIKDRIYRCALFLRLLNICLDNLQAVILANRETHPKGLEMKRGEKYAKSCDKQISRHILVWSKYRK